MVKEYDASGSVVSKSEVFATREEAEGADTVSPLAAGAETPESTESDTQPDPAADGGPEEGQEVPQEAPVAPAEGLAGEEKPVEEGSKEE